MSVDKVTIQTSRSKGRLWGGGALITALAITGATVFGLQLSDFDKEGNAINKPYVAVDYINVNCVSTGGLQGQYNACIVKNPLSLMPSADGNDDSGTGIIRRISFEVGRNYRGASFDIVTKTSPSQASGTVIINNVGSSTGSYSIYTTGTEWGSGHYLAAVTQTVLTGTGESARLFARLRIEYSDIFGQ